MSSQPFYFDLGFNCAQAVLLHFAEQLKLSENNCQQLALAFGGGMGRMQKTCGAVTGAFMAIGAIAAQLPLSDDEKKEKAYLLVKEYTIEFLKHFPSLDCSALLNCDLNSEQGKNTFKNDDLRNKYCKEFVKRSILIAESILADNSSKCNNPE